MGEPAAKPPRAPPGRRRAARLAAVQALYQLDLGGEEVETVILEFRTHRLTEGPAQAADPALFADLVRGAWRRRGELDRLLSQALVADWPIERLECVLRALLRAAVYELLVRHDIPPKVVINEYLEVAHAFFSEREPQLVNGVLDALAQRLRGERLSDDAHGNLADGG
ncbi:MAG: transcription antitermination factor NusB [Alphaproteobacteria bacterium]|nr:transcription antitermination factor NusB [Alphaproteobacteria bacterium]